MFSYLQNSIIDWIEATVKSAKSGYKNFFKFYSVLILAATAFVQRNIRNVFPCIASSLSKRGNVFQGYLLAVVLQLLRLM